MMKGINFLCFIFIAFFFSLEAKAERCWMVDSCEGNYYIYVPQGHYDMKYVKEHGCDKEIYSKRYLRVFDNNNLPEVGEFVMVVGNDTTGFSSIAILEESYDLHDNYKYSLVKKYNLPRECSIMKYMTYKNSRGSLLMGGLKVKILSYIKTKAGLVAYVNMPPNQIEFRNGEYFIKD